MDKKVAIIVPIYNEEETLEESFQRLHKTFLNSNFNVFFLMVNDGSSDASYEVMTKISSDFENVSIATLPTNSGKGAAIRHGFEMLINNFDFVGFIDADLDLNPAYFERLTDQAVYENLSVSIGSKRHRKSKLDYPFHRRFFSLIYRFFVRFLTKVNCGDSQTGMKLFRQDVLVEISPYLTLKSFALDVEILALCTCAKYSIDEFPIEINYQNKTSLTFRSSFIAITDLLRVRLSINKYRKERASQARGRL
jgi:glycosyltransferase involved in cell wall biosynthesis